MYYSDDILQSNHILVFLTDICDDPNAEYHPCGKLCGPTACGITNRDDRHHRYCPERCESQGSCVCKKGYMQNFDGKCVLPEECSKSIF